MALNRALHLRAVVDNLYDSKREAAKNGVNSGMCKDWRTQHVGL